MSSVAALRKGAKAAIAAALTLASFDLLSGEASAATITLSNLGQVAPGTSGALTGANVTLGATSDAPVSTGANPSDPLGWDPWGASDTNSQWLSVGGSGTGTIPADASATFNFGAPATAVTLLWGSPNPGNTLTLFSGANGTGSVIGTVSVDSAGYLVNGVPNSGVSFGPNTTGSGDLVTISSTAAFMSALLTNDAGGFEVADVSATLDPTPLPAALPLFAGGLGVFGWLGRRRKRNAQTV